MSLTVDSKWMNGRLCHNMNRSSTRIFLTTAWLSFSSPSSSFYWHFFSEAWWREESTDCDSLSRLFQPHDSQPIKLDSLLAVCLACRGWRWNPECCGRVNASWLDIRMPWRWVMNGRMKTTFKDDSWKPKSHLTTTSQRLFFMRWSWVVGGDNFPGSYAQGMNVGRMLRRPRGV